MAPRASGGERKERHSDDPKSSVKAPPKKAGGGGKYTLGKVGDEQNAAGLEHGDPNYDPEERRTDPDDGIAYTFDELLAFYKGKFKTKMIEEYWEYECQPVKKKARPKQREKEQKDTSQYPLLPKSQAWVKAKAKAKDKTPRVSAEDAEPGGPLAKEIAAVIPSFPFKKLEVFYDIQGLLKHPKLFDRTCAVFAKHCRKLGATKIVGFEARGFLFTPVAIELGLPFIMLRKEGKMPNTIKGTPHSKEYEGQDVLCIQRGALEKGDKVVLVDDLLATGGTLCAGIELVKTCEAEVVECCCLVEMMKLSGREKCLEAGAKSVFGLVPDEMMTTKAELPDDYVDDGK